jgi:hypothetical protein
MQAAAAAGQLDVLRWAHAQQPPLKIDAWASRAAAANGRVHVLQWLRAHAVPWDVWTTRAGASNPPYTYAYVKRHKRGCKGSVVRLSSNGLEIVKHHANLQALHNASSNVASCIVAVGIPLPLCCFPACSCRWWAHCNAGVAAWPATAMPH